MVEKLLKSLIEIPSLSGKEEKIASFVFKYLKNSGLKPKLLLGNNVYCEVGRGKRVLLLNSHLDTVPPSDSWTLKPFEAKIINGKIHGLGAADTKGNLAAMMEVMVDLQRLGEKSNGKVIFVATKREETWGSGMEKLAKKIKFDAAVIGEPTKLDICIAEKGILGMKVISKGKTAHAAIPGAKNTIHILAEEIVKLSNLKFKKKHKLLGLPTIQATIINGGFKSNVIPDRCECVFNIRTTPIYPNKYLLELIKRKINSEVEILSNRIFPKETEEEEKIVQATKKASPKSKIAGFFATSDWAFIEKPAIILGAGNPKQAHGPDEFVEISQMEKAKEIYKKIIQNYFENEN